MACGQPCLSPFRILSKLDHQIRDVVETQGIPHPLDKVESHPRSIQVPRGAEEMHFSHAAIFDIMLRIAFTPKSDC